MWKITENGSTLFVGGHGGFGTGKFNASGAFQLKVADLFLSNGWVNREKNIEPVGNFRVRNSIKKENKNGYGLIICVACQDFLLISDQWCNCWANERLF